MTVVPGKGFVIIVGAMAWGGFALGMLSSSREPQPALAQFARLIPPPVFDERWHDAVEPEALPKADRLVLARTEPQPIRTEKLVLAKPVKLETKPKKKSLRDGPCAKGKKYTRGGKSWRCRR